MGSGKSRARGPITRVNYLFHTLQEPATMYNPQMYGGYQQQPAMGYGYNQNYNQQMCYGCRWK